MPQAATIKSLPAAFGMMKAMQAEGAEWGEDYRLARAKHSPPAREPHGRGDRQAPRRMAERGQADRRNGCYRRWLLTELGALELAVPRTRTLSALRWSRPTPAGCATSTA